MKNLKVTEENFGSLLLKSVEDALEHARQISITRNIIGFGGQAGTGKGSAASALVKHFGYTEVCFGDALKEFLSDIFSISNDIFYVRELKDKDFDKPIILKPYHICKLLDILGDELNDDFYELEVDLIAEFEGYEFTSPGNMMQVIGTDIVRNRIDKDIWIDIFDVRTKNIEKLVCSDVRFSNERQYIKDQGGEIVLIKRQDLDKLDRHNHESENNLGSEDEYNVIVENRCYNPIHISSDIRTWYAHSYAKRHGLQV